MAERKRQEVSPSGNQADYGDSFYASLYNTMVSFGLNEQRLIWMRYAGFLVLQGFIISAVARGSPQPAVMLALSLLGIACGTAWHIINFAGWLNQNQWFTTAAGLKFTKLTIELPTAWWEKERALRPTGRIYQIAQAVPLALILVYAAGVAQALIATSLNAVAAFLTAGMVVVLAVVLFATVEQQEYADRSRKEEERSIS